MGNIRKLIEKLKYFILFGSVFLSETALAQTGGGTTANILTMFENFKNSSIAIIKLTIAVSMVIGLYLMGSAIFKMAALGDTGGQRGDSMRAVLTRFFIGVMLFSLMFSMRTIGETLMMGGPGDFVVSGGSSPGAAPAITGILWFIRLIGFIAFVRGFLILDKHGRGGQDGDLGRGLTHIFGGAFAIHIDKTAKILFNSFAPGMTLPF